MTTENRTAKWIASAKLTYRPIMAYASPIGPCTTRAWVDEHGVQAYATWDGSHCIYSRHPDNGRGFYVTWDGQPITHTDWIASAELVDAMPAGDLHGPTYDELLRGAAEASYEAERRLCFKDGDWTPESYAPHHAALERYYELYKLAPAWCRVITGSAA